MTKEDILERSKKLKVKDIRFDKFNPTLDDYSKALDSAEKLDEEFSDDLFRKADEAISSGVKI